MPGSFKFFKDSARTSEDESSDFSEAKVMVYKDGGENEYILDASDITGLNKIDDLKLSNLKDIKIKYQPKDSRNAEEVEGLGNIIGKLFATKSASTANSKTILEEEVAKEPVAEAVLGAKDTGGRKSILVEKLGTFLNNNDDEVYENKIAKDFLAEKYPLAKIDGSNATKELATAILTIDGNISGTSVLKEKAADKNVAEAILGATSDKDGKKSILVEKLGEFLPKTDPMYDSKSAGDFLAEKSSLVKTDGSNATKELATAILTIDGNISGTSVLKEKAADKNVAEAVLGAKDGQKSILVKELGTLLSDTATSAQYEGQTNQKPVEYLASKGKLITEGNLGAKAASVPVAGAILGAKDGQKSILVEELGKALGRVANNADDKVYGDNPNDLKIAKDFLAEKSSLVKTDGSNIASSTDEGKALASAILGVEYTDSDSKTRSVLVEKLGDSLGNTTDIYKAKYDGSNEQIAKAYLSAKVGPSIDDVASKLAREETFKTAVTSTLAKPEAIAAVPALKTAVATQLLNDTNKTTLATAVLDSKDSAQKKLSALVLDAKDSAQKTLQEQLAGNGGFISNVKVAVNAEEIREAMSKPAFEIPADENAPLSWDWI